MIDKEKLIESINSLRNGILKKFMDKTDDILPYADGYRNGFIDMIKTISSMVESGDFDFKVKSTIEGKLEEGSTFNYEPEFLEIKSKMPLTLKLPQRNERKIVDYLVCVRNNHGSFKQLIIKKIEEGYQPFGFPFFRDDLYSQAMVKYEDAKNEQ